MKEAFWGVFIILLGAIGIVAINLFQDLTVTTDQNYYLMKEATKAAMEDSLDMSYYRIQGPRDVPKPRIVKEAFVENLTRRFASSAVLNKDYTIIIHDIVEQPPKVSLSLVSNAKDIKGGKYDVLLNIDSIYEGIYGKNVTFGDDKFPFPIIGEDPETVIIPGEDPKIYPDDGKCPNFGGEVVECISGDLQFVGWGPAPSASRNICPEDLPNLKPQQRDAKYKSCICGKWEDPKTEVITAPPVRYGNKSTYTWNFVKNGPINNINESVKQDVVAGICTKGIKILIKDDIPKTISGGTECPPEGITILVGEKRTLYPRYIPLKSINRDLTWTADTQRVTLNDIVPSVQYPFKDYVIVTGKHAGETIVTATTTNKLKDNCKVKVVDLADFSCPDKPLVIGSGSVGYAVAKDGFKSPGMKFSITNENIATIDSQTGLIKAKSDLTSIANIKYNISLAGKTITCPLTIKPIGTDDPIPVPPVGSNSCYVGNIALSSTSIVQNSVPACLKDTSLNSFFKKALKGSKIKVRYCSRNTPFVSCGNGIWDSTGEIPLDVPLGENYIISTNLTKFDTKTNQYSISYTVNINNDGWQKDLINKNCKGTSVIQSYSGTINGKLTADVCTPATTSESRTLEISNCPDTLLKGNTASVGISLDPPGLDSEGKPIKDRYEWTITNNKNISITGSGSSIKVTALKPSTETLTIEVYSGNDPDPKFSKKCEITVPEDPCLTTLNITPSRTCLIAGSEKTFSVGSGYSNIFGNSNWEVSGNIIYNGSTTSNNIFITGINSGKGGVTLGTLKYKTQYNCDGKQKEQIRILTIYPKGDYFCSNLLYPELSGSKCFAAPIMQILNKKPECSPNQVSYGGNCYNQSDMPAATYVEAKCPSGSTLMCAGGSAQGCSYYFCGTTTKSQICTCPTGTVLLNNKCYSKVDDKNNCSKHSDGYVSGADCYYAVVSKRCSCPSGTAKNAVDSKCYNTTDIQNAYYHCTRGTETGYMIYNKCIYQTTKKELPNYCSGNVAGVPYIYNSSKKLCVLAVDANPVDCPDN